MPVQNDEDVAKQQIETFPMPVQSDNDVAKQKQIETFPMPVQSLSEQKPCCALSSFRVRKHGSEQELTGKEIESRGSPGEAG